MKTEITIQAVCDNGEECEGCMLNFPGEPCLDCAALMERIGLPACDSGYIYQIKESDTK